MPSEQPPETPDPPAVILARRDPSHDAIAEVAAAAAGRRGMIVVGPQDDPDVLTTAPLLAAAAGWPILADALSGLRCGPHDRSAVVASGDPLAWGGWLDRAVPEFVVRVGAIPTSKPIWQWLESARQVPQVFVEPAGWRDPMASATTVIRADPARTLVALAKAIDTPSDPSWLAAWHRADQVAAAAIDGVLERVEFPSEPALARLVGRAAPDRSTLGWGRRCRCATSTPSSNRPIAASGSWAIAASTASTA
jgi:2-succinyl-5-enolpyruvyl-6-hydroxy-3-cyclohexene-1-carboxylate synthase